MYRASVIFEGGGMRGTYATGVIDVFLEHGIEFSSIYGVSSGACHATSYISQQYGRAYRLCSNYLHDKEYCSLHSLITTGNLFGRDLMFRRFHEELDPFDFNTFAAYQGKFYSVATNLKTGKPEYLPVSPESPRNRFPEVCASMSMPFLSRVVHLNNKAYLDGFVGDSIPVRKSIADGNTKNVLVLTRPADYHKKFEMIVPFVFLRYPIYPRYFWSYCTRAKRYNETLAFINAEEKKGNLFVIRPREALPVGTVTKDLKKIRKLYDFGYEDASSRIDELIEYLNS